jgi:hypothetical protein
MICSTRTFSLLVAALAPVLASGCGGGAAKSTTKATTDKQMFDALGVDTTTSSRTYVDGAGATQTLTDSYNPLGTGVRTLHPLSEIYVAGRGVAGHPSQVLLDDLKNGPTPTPLALTDADETWTANTYLASLAADLDGDGIDEIVNVYWIDTMSQLHARVLKCTGSCTGNGGTFSEVMDSPLGVQSTTTAPNDRSWFKHGVTAADVDGDGKKELVIGNFGGIDLCTAAPDFSFSCVAKWTSAAATHMSLATGHFNDLPGVQNDSVVVAWSDGQLGHVSIYDGTPNAFGANATTNPNHAPIDLAIQFADQSSVLSFSEAYVTAGDFDLDGRDEIVLAAREAGQIVHDLILLDDAQVFYRPFKAFRYPLGDDGGDPGPSFLPNSVNNTFRPVVKVFTKTGGLQVANGAGTMVPLQKAIYAGEEVLDGIAGIYLSSVTSLGSNQTITNGVTATDMGYYETGGGGYNHAPDDVVAGDIDGSGHDTIVAMWDEANDASKNDSTFLPATLASLAWDAGNATWPRWTNFFTTTSGMAPVAQGSLTETDGSYGPGLALANVDRDSPIVKYSGKHEELFGTPRVVAVLGAAPFFKGENETNSSTSISLGSGTGVDAQSTIGVSAGFSIGYEAPSLFGLDTASWKLSFNASLDSISTTDVQIAQTVTWTAGAEDAVVFHVIPFDVYYYTVVSSPDPSELGQQVSINVPRTVETFKVPVDLYNSSIVDGPTIGPDVLTHKVGDPSSYPTANACASATGIGTFGGTSYLVNPTATDVWCYAVATAEHVGVGSGSVGFQIARTDTSSTGVSQNYAVDFETEAGAGGFTVGASVGFHWGYQYTVDAQQSYNFAGQVGDLPNATHGYDFGLMAHQGMLAGTTELYPVFLVDYWVANVQ